jgi:hypothetical protein
MPLTSGKSREVVSQNIRELHTGKTFAHTEGKFGKDRANKQAVAIALSEARKSRAVGGGVANYDAGGGVDPVNAVIQALNAGSSLGGGGIIGSSNPASPSAAPASADKSSSATPPSTAIPATGSTSTAAQAPAAVTAGVSPTNNTQPVSTAPAPANPASFASPSPAAPPPTAAPASTSFAPTTPAVPSPSVVPQNGSGFQGIVPQASTAPLNINGSLLADGGVANRAGGGGFNMKSGPSITAPWEERGAARNLHVGPVLSNVLGRTDAHQVKVPAGSYVLPSTTISSFGHGNTLAGASLASKMFGMPYGGGSDMKIGGGHGNMPKPPKIAAGPGIANLATGGYTYSEGGSRGERYAPDELVPVDIAGGEHVIEPAEIIRRWGSLKNGHAVLDQFVMDQRKKEIATQKALPPPAKE